MFVRTTAGNKQIRIATSLSGEILGWDEHLEFIQDASYDATSLSEQRERETSGSNERFIGKTTTQEKIKTVIKQRQRSVHRMVGSGTREAQGRVRRGGLLDEGADCVCEVGFVKRRQTPVSNRPLKKNE